MVRLFLGLRVGLSPDKERSPHVLRPRQLESVLMNTLLASGGYPWTVIRMSRRDEYMKALEAASVRGQITPLAEFIAQEMREWVPERTDRS